MKKILIIFCLALISPTIFAQPCQNLPNHFKSYNEAVRKVRAAEFVFNDSVDCARSSWIHSASYYSCDNKIGYLIMRTKEGREYIHQNLPIEIWQQFKNASSFGSYYNHNIRGRYRLTPQ